MTSNILSITEKKVPSIIGLRKDSHLIIGNAARELGIKGHTNTYHFKPELGKVQDDTLYIARTGKTGQKLRTKTKPYWISNPESQEIQTFTPLEATQTFLQQLIPTGDGDPRQIIVGEPALDEKWREHYRKNIIQVLTRFNLEEPYFFPEPFAVYQYYRHIEGLIEDTEEQQTVLVIDFGGGTFDCCVIRTTKAGELARSGAHSLPLGVQSLEVAGEGVDIELLNIVKRIAEANKVIFKDDPINRARKTAQSLWLIENTKIKISEAIENSSVNGGQDLLKVIESIELPSESFHGSENIHVDLNGKHLQDAVTQLWNRGWGKSLLTCHQEAEKKLGTPIKHYDIVLVAGGSAKLPGITNLIQGTLPNQLRQTKIIISKHAEAAVAKGIAIECKEQADKRPSLVNNRLVSCLQNNLYIQCGRKKDERYSPKIKGSNSVSANNEGLVYQSPGLLRNNVIECTLELRVPPRATLFFWFHGSSNRNGTRLNVASNSIRIPGNPSVDKKIFLKLTIEEDGTVTPQFTFKHHGRNPQSIQSQPFNIGAEQIKGTTYLGVDFGTCNSYIAQFVIPEKILEQASYPEYEVTRDTAAQLLKLEQRCQELREHNTLNKDKLIEHARKNELDFVFHSNKIEGNKLSHGDTKRALKKTKRKGTTKDEKEALNLRNAYHWMLEMYEGCTDQISAFAREVNKQLLQEIEEKAGSFRSEDVTINGVDFKPPPWGSVDDFMYQLSKEINKTKANTSGLELAVRAHTKLVAIHPFIDGNGRTARLLLSAILLAYNLPVLVLNADDKERYLTALGYSNNGSLDALLIFFLEIMNQTLQEIEAKDNDLIEPKNQAITEDTPIDDQEASRLPSEKTISKTTSDKSKKSSNSKRLTSLLKKKTELRKEVQKATYSAWKNAFEMFRNELSAYVHELDEMDTFRDAGYDIRFSEFDTVTERNFDALWTRRDTSHTWFCSITIYNAIENENYGLMFQFGRCSDKMRTLENATAPVTCTLAIGGVNTGSWLPVREEPIKLREIGYVDGSLIYMDFDGALMRDGFNEILNELICDLMGE